MKQGTLKGRLTLVVVVCVIAMLILLSLAWVIGEKNNRRMNEFVDLHLALHLKATAALGAGLQKGQSLRNIFLDPQNRKAYENFAKAEENLSKLLTDVESLLKKTDAGESASNQLKSQASKLAPIQSKVMEMVERQDIQGAREILIREETVAWREMRGTLLEIVKRSEETTQTLRAELQDNQVFARNLTLGIGLSVIAFVIVAIGWVSRGVMRTIGGEPEVVKIAVERIASGDLTKNLTVEPGDTDSLIAHQQQMQKNLCTTLKGVSQSATETESAAEALSCSAQQVAAASADSSESASSMASSIEQLSVSISQVSDNTQSALQQAETAMKKSSQGGGVIEQAVAEINRIATSVRETSHSMVSLRESSAQISNVVQVIKDVADQTNLLALNAAIEAARAGEQGRGFAVVADEVRKLAERTTSATAEIAGMIQQIQADTGASLQTMESAVVQVDKGVDLANEAGVAIADIRNSVSLVVSTVSEIVSSINEQSVASQQIAQAVERIAQAAEENNAAAQGASSAANRLTVLASEVKHSISRFRLG